MRRARIVAAALTVALLLLPTLVVGVPPLSDYVNHIARAHVLAHLGDTEAYRAAYASAWGPYPNLAFDLVAVPLTKVASAELAGRVFLALTVLVFSAGCHALGKAALGRLSWRATAACFFVMCEPFLLGYASFTFGVGLALLATAALLHAHQTRRTAWLGVAAGLGLLVAISHAAAIVTFGIVAASFALARLLEGGGPRVALRDLAAAAPGGGYFLLWLLVYADRSNDKSWASPGTSARVLATSILPSYEPRADLPILATLVIAAAAWVVLARPVKLDRPLSIVAALCAAAVFVAPSDFAGSYEANGRYALGAWVFALFSPRAKELPALRAAPVVALAFAALLGRQLLVTRSWLELGRELGEQRELLRHIADRDVVANVTFLDPRAPRSTRLRQLALLHAPALAAIDRQAVVPTLYAIRGVQPLAHTTPRYAAHRFKTGEVDSVDTTRLRAEADVVWLCRAPEPLVAKLQPVEELGRSGDCVLVRIR